MQLNLSSLQIFPNYIHHESLGLVIKIDKNIYKMITVLIISLEVRQLEINKLLWQICAQC